MCHRQSNDFHSYTVRTSFKNIFKKGRRREGKEKGKREGVRKEEEKKGGREGEGKRNGGRKKCGRQAL